MDQQQIEREFRDELRKTYQNHESLKDQFEENEFCKHVYHQERRR
jgi:hypothetical protein